MHLNFSFEITAPLSICWNVLLESAGQPTRLVPTIKHHEIIEESEDGLKSRIVFSAKELEEHVKINEKKSLIISELMSEGEIDAILTLSLSSKEKTEAILHINIEWPLEIPDVQKKQMRRAIRDTALDLKYKAEDIWMQDKIGDEDKTTH